MAKLGAIEGIGVEYSAKLAAAGVITTEELLQAGSTPQGRQALAEKTGIAGSLILEWVNLADLFRVKGIGQEYSDLLEEAGVDTVPELAQRNPDNLYAAVVAANQTRRLVRHLPGRGQVANWVAQAKALERIIEY